MGQSSSTLFALDIAFTILASIFIFLRIYVRSRKDVGFGRDDFAICTAFIMFIAAYTIPMAVLSRNYHLGDHVPRSPQGKPIPPSYHFNLWSRILQSLSPIPIGLTKIGVLLFYRRIFRGKKFSIFNWILIGLSIGWTLANFFGDVFQCVNPISVMHVPGQKCINNIKFYYGAATSDFLIDLLILALPLPIIWKLNMRQAQKIAVTGIFLLGLLTVACSITRLGEFVKAGRIIASGSPDYTYDVAPTVVWSMLEASIGMISACLITLRPIFKGWSPESIIRSVRSVLSLQSIGSRTSRHSENSRHAEASSSNARKRTESSGSSAVGLQPNFDFSHAGKYDASGLGHKAQVDSTGVPLGELGHKQDGIIVQKGWERSDSLA